MRGPPSGAGDTPSPQAARLFHFDSGSEVGADSLRKLLERRLAVQSMSRWGRWLEQRRRRRFFLTLEDEEPATTIWCNISEAKHEISTIIES